MANCTLSESTAMPSYARLATDWQTTGNWLATDWQPTGKRLATDWQLTGKRMKWLTSACLWSPNLCNTPQHNETISGLRFSLPNSRLSAANGIHIKYTFLVPCKRCEPVWLMVMQWSITQHRAHVREGRRKIRPHLCIFVFKICFVC